VPPHADPPRDAPTALRGLSPSVRQRTRGVHCGAAARPGTDFTSSVAIGNPAARRARGPRRARSRSPSRIRIHAATDSSRRSRSTSREFSELIRPDGGAALGAAGSLRRTRGVPFAPLPPSADTATAGHEWRARRLPRDSARCSSPGTPSVWITTPDSRAGTGTCARVFFVEVSASLCLVETAALSRQASQCRTSLGHTNNKWRYSSG
jgi:hypothetical protein